VKPTMACAVEFPVPGDVATYSTSCMYIVASPLVISQDVRSLIDSDALRLFDGRRLIHQRRRVIMEAQRGEVKRSEKLGRTPSLLDPHGSQVLRRIHTF
jgi:hypothetical protein